MNVINPRNKNHRLKDAKFVPGDTANASGKSARQRPTIVTPAYLVIHHKHVKKPKHPIVYETMPGINVSESLPTNYLLNVSYTVSLALSTFTGAALAKSKVYGEFRMYICTYICKQSQHLPLRLSASRIRQR